MIIQTHFPVIIGVVLKQLLEFLVPMAPFFQVEMVVAVAEMLKEIQLVLGQFEDFNCIY